MSEKKAFEFGSIGYFFDVNDKQYLVTANHVTDGAVELWQPGCGKYGEPEIISVTPWYLPQEKLDVVACQLVDNVNHDESILELRDARVQEDVLLLGFCTGFSQGYVSSISCWRNGHMYEFEIIGRTKEVIARHGDSGGAIISSNGDHLVGIFSQLTDDGTAGYAVHMRHVKKTLIDNVIEGAVSPEKKRTVSHFRNRQMKRSVHIFI